MLAFGKSPSILFCQEEANCQARACEGISVVGNIANALRTLPTKIYAILGGCYFVASLPLVRLTSFSHFSHVMHSSPPTATLEWMRTLVHRPLALEDESARRHGEAVRQAVVVRHSWTPIKDPTVENPSLVSSGGGLPKQEKPR